MTTGLLHVHAVQGDTEDHNGVHITIPSSSAYGLLDPDSASGPGHIHIWNVQSETLGLTRDGWVSRVTNILQSLHLFVIHTSKVLNSPC